MGMGIYTTHWIQGSFSLQLRSKGMWFGADDTKSGNQYLTFTECCIGLPKHIAKLNGKLRDRLGLNPATFQANTEKNPLAKIYEIEGELGRGSTIGEFFNADGGLILFAVSKYNQVNVFFRKSDITEVLTWQSFFGVLPEEIGVFKKLMSKAHMLEEEGDDE